jgi:manganese/iron transport system permease protein
VPIVPIMPIMPSVPGVPGVATAASVPTVAVWELLGPFEAPYMHRALVELVLLGILGGVVGVHVLLRRLAFVTEAVQHTVFPGIAIAFAAGGSLLVGALASGLLSVVLLTVGAGRRRIDPDALLALLVAVFVALGVVVVSRRSGYQRDLSSLLFGRILAVDRRQVIDTAIIAAACLVALLALHKELVLRAFDPGGTAALGYRTAWLDLVLNVVITLTVVAAVRAVGTVLVVAFVVTPAAAARLVTHRVGMMMAFAAAFACAGGWLGLVISYEGSLRHGWRLASGATVVLTLTAGFVLIAGGRAIVQVRNRRAGPG